LALVSPRGLLAIATAAAGGWLAGRVNRSRHEGPDERGLSDADLIPGAEPVALQAGPRGVLILHGFGDTPQSVRALALTLHERGWSVRAPLLHGHGCSLRAFMRARARDWLTDARNALRELSEHSTPVAIIGQSMGGALATILAAEAPVDALVLLVPYMRLSGRASRIAAFHRVVTPLVPYLRSRSEFSILDPDARRRALGRGVTTPRLLHELSLVVREARRAAPRVRAPALVIHSRNDPRVTTADADASFARLGSSRKSLEWVNRSGHVISVDFDRDWVAQRVHDWLNVHVGARRASPGAK
jgi:carboxylesterase